MAILGKSWMKRHVAFALAFVATLALLAGGWFFLSSEADTVPAAVAFDPEQTVGAGILDGMTFAGDVGLRGEELDIRDRFVFEDGQFVSKECEVRCKYPARPYYVREVAGAAEFISETRCPYKDAKIVWRGTVHGDRIEGVATWTLSRWYWTIEKELVFVGTLERATAPLTSD